MTSEQKHSRLLRAVGVTAGALVLFASLLRGGWPVNPAFVAKAAISLLALGAGVLLAFGPGGKSLFARLAGILFRAPRRPWNGGLFMAAAGVSAYVSWNLFDRMPYLDDGISFLFQARIFARGSIVLPLPPDAGFFDLFCVIGAKADIGRWASMYPPGWPALLVPGVLLGVPWLVNPLLGGALAVATGELGRELYDDRVGRVAGLFVLGSPFFAILAATHLSHTATALFCVLCLWAVLRLGRTGGVRYGLVAGAAWGAAFLCRPLDALLLGSLFALVPLFSPRRSLLQWRAIVVALAIAVLAALTLAWHQHVLTGDALTPGHKIGMGKLGSFGFINIPRSKVHTPARAVEFTLLRLRALNDRLLAWPVPFLLFPVFALVAGPIRRRDLLLLACPLVLAGAFAFYWWYEVYFPARYLSAGVPMLLILGSRGLLLLGDAASRWGEVAGRLFAGILCGCVLFAVLVATPQQFAAVRRNSGDVEQTLPRVVEAYDIHHAVVFMDQVNRGGKDEADDENDYFATGFTRNTLDLDGDILYARNSREENWRLIERYPGRSYYLYRYDRGSRKAFLYRLLPEGRGYCLSAVPPGETDLLLFDSRPMAETCLPDKEPPRSATPAADQR